MEPEARSSKSKPSQATPSDTILLLGRAVPVTKTPAGLRAMVKGKPESAAAVQRYLEQKFGTDLATVKAAMTTLAKAAPPRQLEHEAFALYEAFRPAIPEGARGWGAKGVLDLDRIRRLADRY